METSSTLQIAAVSDIHYGAGDRGKLRDLFTAVTDAADVLLLCGDLTNHGKAEEVDALTDDLSRHVDIPMLGVLGNHDFESGRPNEVVNRMRQAGVQMLDGESIEIGGVGFAGVPGFSGGFGKYALNAWGESATKHYVQTVIDEKLKLERALSTIDVKHKVVLLHYAPIEATVVGEPKEIYPFLGSSRLEPPLNNFDVTAVFHGHAHIGTAEGRTSEDIPVYNVSIPLLTKEFPDRPPFRLLEVGL